jgi:Cdc6-like AAA superfamily ATPase
MESEDNGIIKNNLPPSIPVFVDRVQELEQIERLFSDPGVNVITVSGPAGIGKTAFATEVARRQVENRRFPGGVVWLNCDALNTLPSILARIAEVIELDYESLSFGGLRDRVLRHLSSTPTLLVFDGYETVAEDDSILSFIGRLPRFTKVLILTRKSVRVPGREISLRLAPFDEPVAMELWRQYLKSEGLAEANIETLREIYRQTGGLPLALRLVAGLIEQGRSPWKFWKSFRIVLYQRK